MARLGVLCVLLLAHHCSARDGYHHHPRNPRRPAPPREGVVSQADPAYWAAEARAAIEARARYTRDGSERPARNVVLFLGDGMSVTTLAAAHTLLGQRRNRTGEETLLSFEAFPNVGLSKTYCLDAQVADSACSATAYLCGAKANLGTIGVSGAVPRFACAAGADARNHVDSVAVWALRDGRDAGLVTTTRVTHASPAGIYAHTADREWESDADVRGAGNDPAVCPDIAQQLINSYPGNQLKVIMGGGRRELLPKDVKDEEGMLGRRTDGRNLIQKWRTDKAALNVTHQYIWNRQQLLAAGVDPPEYLLGLFDGSHMQYHLEANKETEPTLAEMTEVAIKSLSRNERGFFLFVEGGRIDHGHHENLAEFALDETIELSEAVQRATELLDEEDSLIVVTSDHSHVMTFAGYTHRGGDIRGATDDLGKDGVPYMKLSYANGPGYRPEVNGSRTDVTKEAKYRSPRWLYPAAVPLDSETHGGEDVGVFAVGAHARMFASVMEESRLPHIMGYAACMGPGLHAPTCPDRDRGVLGWLEDTFNFL